MKQPNSTLPGWPWSSPPKWAPVMHHLCQVQLKGPQGTYGIFPGRVGRGRLPIHRIPPQRVMGKSWKSWVEVEVLETDCYQQENRRKQESSSTTIRNKHQTSWNHPHQEEHQETHAESASAYLLPKLPGRGEHLIQCLQQGAAGLRCRGCVWPPWALPKRFTQYIPICRKWLEYMFVVTITN